MSNLSDFVLKIDEFSNFDRKFEIDLPHNRSSGAVLHHKTSFVFADAFLLLSTAELRCFVGGEGSLWT